MAPPLLPLCTMMHLRLGVAAVLAASVLTIGCSSHHEDADPYADGDSSVDPYRPTDDGGSSTPTTTTPPPKTGDGGSGPTADAASGADGGADTGTSPGVACLDDSAPAVQPACPGNGDCQEACDNFAGDYKKGLSADIRKCLTDAICLADTSTCSNAALAKACADPTATTFCTPMVSGCKASNPADTITQASCETLAKGLTSSGRANLQSCFETDSDCGGCLAKMR